MSRQLWSTRATLRSNRTQTPRAEPSGADTDTGYSLEVAEASLRVTFHTLALCSLKVTPTNPGVVLHRAENLTDHL